MSVTYKHTPAPGMSGQAFLGGPVDARMIGVMRCVLAFSGLAIIWLDPTEPARLAALTYTSLVVYCIWSAVLLFMASRGEPAAAAPPRYSHWGDVLFCAYLVTLTQGTSSIFFFFFLFAILVASFSRGFREGLLVTGASVILFVLAGLWFGPGGGGFELGRTLIRLVTLLTLGYMIAYWGGREITQRRRLKLLHEVNNQWNPRFGHDQTIGTNIERMLDFFAADTCILVLKRMATPPAYLTYQASRGRRGQAAANTINEATAQILLRLPATFSACHDQAPPAWWKRVFRLSPRDTSLSGECGGLANLLETRCFMTVPYAERDGTAGRVFLTPANKSFSQSDVEFAAQLVMAISRVVESMQLMDELVAKAAEHERYRISLDIHDTTVQPYIGLKLGLNALHREAGTDNPLSRRIGELLEMTETTIQDLRRYATTLREDTSLAGDSLVAAVREQADRFKRFYGIEIAVQCDSEVRVNARLAGAVLPILAEGLSNIRRHTQARRALIALRCENGKLLLEIANESPEEPDRKADFTPRSINARVLSLGGTSFVERDAQGYTVVHISIPL